ncbi:MAG TPA: helix-turn-helix transcriptional regulator [Rhizomicrobium sp.]|nr:helix-turn-helix transcriptional regulator [Rhizomicrobium sp.]
MLAIDARIGKALRDLRKQRKLTQSDLAPTLGVSFQQIQKIERGNNRLSVSQLLAAARFFDVGIDHFLPELRAHGGSDEPASEMELADFAASARGRNLMRAFLAIRDEENRAAIERFIRAIAADE